LFNIYMQAAGSRQQAGHSSLAYKPYAYAYAYAYAYVNRFTLTPGAASSSQDQPGAASSSQQQPGALKSTPPTLEKGTLPPKGQKVFKSSLLD
jgi:hypothetical protein